MKTHSKKLLAVLIIIAMLFGIFAVTQRAFADTVVASVDGTDYEDFETALEAALESSKTLTLQSPITYDRRITINEGKTLNIDLNGRNLTGTVGGFLKVDGGTLNITNSSSTKATVQGTNQVISIVGTTDETNDYSNVTVGNNVKLVALDDWAIVVWQSTSGEIKKANGVNITITGAEIECEDNAFWILGNVQKDETYCPVVNISNSTITTKGTRKPVLEGGDCDDPTISLMGYGRTTITNTTINGRSSAVGIKSGIVNLINPSLIAGSK